MEVSKCYRCGYQPVHKKECYICLQKLDTFENRAYDSYGENSARCYIHATTAPNKHLCHICYKGLLTFLNRKRTKNKKEQNEMY